MFNWWYYYQGYCSLADATPPVSVAQYNLNKGDKNKITSNGLA